MDKYWEKCKWHSAHMKEMEDLLTREQGLWVWWEMIKSSCCVYRGGWLGRGGRGEYYYSCAKKMALWTAVKVGNGKWLKVTGGKWERPSQRSSTRAWMCLHLLRGQSVTSWRPTFSCVTACSFQSGFLLYSKTISLAACLGSFFFILMLCCEVLDVHYWSMRALCPLQQCQSTPSVSCS